MKRKFHYHSCSPGLVINIWYRVPARTASQWEGSEQWESRVGDGRWKDQHSRSANSKIFIDPRLFPCGITPVFWILRNTYLFLKNGNRIYLQANLTLLSLKSVISFQDSFGYWAGFSHQTNWSLVFITTEWAGMKSCLEVSLPSSYSPWLPSRLSPYHLSPCGAAKDHGEEGAMQLWWACANMTPLGCPHCCPKQMRIACKEKENKWCQVNQ